MTTASPPKNCWLSYSIILTIQVLNPGARNGSPSVMEGLICLCLEAAPGYISLAVSAHARPPATIASPLHTLSYTISSSPSLELSSPAALAAIPSFTKTFQVYFLLAALHICTTTLQFGSTLIPPSSTFTFFLSKALDLEHSTIPVSSPCPRHWLRSPPLRSTLEVYSLLAAICISTTPLQLDSRHDCRLMNSIDHHIVRLRRRRSIVLDRPRIPHRNLLRPLPSSSPSLLSLPPPCLTLGGGHPRCH
jgi:hypothetical protein